MFTRGKQAVRSRTPQSVRRFIGHDEPPADRLFGGDDELFKSLVQSAEVYGEYGMGKSTKYAIRSCTCHVISVETSAEYVDMVTRDVDHDPRLHATHVDVGPIGDWGRPLTYAKRSVFPTYASHVWDQELQPDLVLIDGRFRVLCFLHSLLRAPAGTPIMFDDYADRQHYHVVEELVQPADRCGRQALFSVPAAFDRHKAEEMARAFTLVWD